MDYTTWSKANLKQRTLTHDSHKTSVWYTPLDDRPLIVLVHGIGGDYSGMVPLATVLAATYRVAIIELPGHGKSGNFPLPSAAALQQWFDSLLGAVEQHIGTAAAICAHSFGCSSILSSTIIARKKIILLNPVPTPSSMYVTYSRAIMNSAHFWAHIYNWRLFVVLRGMTLVKLHTREAMDRVRWVGRQSHPTFNQIVFQAGLVDVVLDTAAYRYVGDGQVALVVCGMFDTTAHQRDSPEMRSVFGDTDIIFLRGGHLLPIESPERVAAAIADAMVH
jgi:pimeloyl-ACP methyl ester carboxylesterase